MTHVNLQKACQQLDIPILFTAGVVDGKGLVSAPNQTAYYGITVKRVANEFVSDKLLRELNK